MNDNLTDITVVLDRSGSMIDCKADVIGGYNTFVDAQRDAEGEAKLTLIQFDSDNPHEVVYTARNIQKVPHLTGRTYVPRGTTPLYDALARAIDATGRRLAELPEERRPGKVVFVITTDGYENASREVNQYKVKEMIKHQESKYAWNFVFMGADIDAMAQGSMIGLSVGSTISIKSANYQEAFCYTAQNLATYRSTGAASSLNYTQAQRDALIGGKVEDATAGDTTDGGVDR
jgi:Mg-chelatase subunit ChlD